MLNGIAAAWFFITILINYVFVYNYFYKNNIKGERYSGYEHASHETVTPETEKRFGCVFYAPGGIAARRRSSAA